MSIFQFRADFLQPELALYHGTSTDRAELIFTDGLVKPGWWGTRAMADYYAEDWTGDEGAAVIIRVPISRFTKSKLYPDHNSIAEPITMVLNKQESELWKEWEACRGTWQDSLRIYQSVLYKATIKVTRQDVVE